MVSIYPARKIKEPHMAATSDRRPTVERVKCLRIFADADGETHMEDVDIPLNPNNFLRIIICHCGYPTT